MEALIGPLHVGLVMNHHSDFSNVPSLSTAGRKRK